MKKKYALADVQAGDSFSQDSYAEGNNLFVPAGIAVRERDLEGFKRWDIQYVYSEGELVKKSERQAKSKSASAAPTVAESREQRSQDEDLDRRYTALLKDTQTVYDLLKAGKLPENTAIEDLAQRVAALVDDKIATIVAVVIGSNVQGLEFARTAVNCAILSLVVGRTLKLPAYRMQQLAIGALLHDIGMLRIPGEILKKNSQLSTEEMQKLKSHPLYTYRTITKELHFSDDIGLIGLQHHERWDGEGYPRRTAGAEIDILARIVSITDAFEAMISQKPYRNSMIGYSAMKVLLSDNGRRFDPDVLKAFLRSMGIYPIGSLVVLNNATIAKVVSSHADAPLRPCLRILVDEFGTHYPEPEGEMVNLLTEKSLFIARAIDPRELVS